MPKNKITLQGKEAKAAFYGMNIMLRNRKKALFVVKPPPRHATEQQWRQYEKENQKWMMRYFLIVWLEIGAIVGIAYLLHITFFS